MPPHGKWIQRAASPTDTSNNIARAKALILDEVRTHGTYTLQQVRAKTPDLNFAALVSAALLLKKEGKL